MAKASGIILWLPIQEGTGTTIFDKSRAVKHDGALVNTPAWGQLPSGKWGLTFVSGSSEKATIGNIGIGRSIELWIKVDDTTEPIFEQSAAAGVDVNAGTLQYGAWDNAFVNGVDTDSLAAVWSHVVITSTTDITMSAVTLALLDATYLNGVIAFAKAYRDELDQSQAINRYQASRHWYGV